MPTQLTTVTQDRYRNIFRILFFAILVVYIADLFTPLRLHVDTVRYYLIKDCIEIGCPPDSDAAHDYFPYGYTALLLILSKLGILKSFTIVLINSIFLVAGTYFVYKVFQKRIGLYQLFVLVLFNWLFIKFVAHPLSEMQYIFFSLSSVYCYHRFTQSKKIWYLLASLLLGWVAFMTRTIGVTLIAAIVLGILWEYREQQLTFFRKNKLLVAGIFLILALALVLFSKFLGLNHYANVLSEHFKEASFLKRVGWRFKEWGEIFINTPSNKIIDRLAGKPGEIAFMAFGLLVLAWFMYTMFSRKNAIPFFIKAYLIFYCLIMFNWPFNDPRFWVPVMPLMAAIVLHGNFTRRLLKAAAIALTIVYLVLGFIAGGYMVYSSYNKEFFVRNQARGSYKNEYEIHFYGKPQSDTAKKIDKDVLFILQRHD